MSLIATVARPTEWLGASRLLSSHLSTIEERESTAEHIRTLMSSGRVDPNGLFVVRELERALLGAALVQSFPGALGLIWPPRIMENRRFDAAEALAQAGCNFLRERGVKVCQMFGEVKEIATFTALARQGFRSVTQLVHLERELNPYLSSGLPHRVSFEPFAEDAETFARSLLASYEGSLDCPELSADRTQLELIEGFQSSGNPRWWFTARLASEPIGVVMWEQSDPRTIEIAYLGLIPAARGRGLAHELVSEAVRFAQRMGANRLSLSVDSRNAPARRLYVSNEFREIDMKEVFLAWWPAQLPTNSRA